MKRLTDEELSRIERECLADPGCEWSAIKLSMVAEIRRHREPGCDLVGHLWRQREFSARAFGPGPRVHGILDHIRRELDEVLREPGDLSEWIDVAMLAFDGAWRSGATPSQIAAALHTKLVKNEAREWPDWRKSDPDKAIEHVRSAGGGAS